MNTFYKIIEFESLASTSEKAKELALAGAEPWTIVLAIEQTGGHGRKGEAWFSPQGGLYVSIILPKSNIIDLQTLTILTAFIIAQTIKNNYKLEPLIKLPNDVLLDGKKVCGILTENVIMGNETLISILGIGLNTNILEFPIELNDLAISLQQSLSTQVWNEQILEQIVVGLKNQLDNISQ